jgi:uncharacterized protein
MNAESRLCEGCLRTLDEIASWGGMSDQEKRLVCDQIERRKGSKVMPGSDRDHPSTDSSGTF